MYDWRDILALGCLVITSIGCALTAAIFIFIIADRRLTHRLENESKREFRKEGARPDAENSPGNPDR